MAGKTTSRPRLKRETDKLRAQLPQDIAPAQRDTIMELCTVSDEIDRVLAGEFRIIAAGAVASMKSTTLELLLGRPGRLRVGLGAVTAAPTELRLVQSDDPVPHRGQVRMLTEGSARRRALALLGLPEDDGRSLTELAETAHPDRALIAGMVMAAKTFTPGHTYDIDEYDSLGGRLHIGGLGASLVDRVRYDVAVSDKVWNLAWAGHRTVVVIDLPGTGEGRSLENLISAQQRAAAHVALNVVGFGSGSGFTPAPIPAESNCVLVATKLDHVEKPANEQELRTLDEAVRSILHKWRQTGRKARVAAISGAWACPDEQSWQAFDPDNSGIWVAAERARQKWAAAAWDPDDQTGTEFREAVEAALADGGARRLRDLIADLATANQFQVDDFELKRLITRALSLVDQVSATPDRKQGERVDLLIDKVESDPRPVDELRRIARETAAEAVYGHPMWDSVCRRSFRPNGEWRGSLVEVRRQISTVDVAGIAAQAIEDADSQLAGALDAWSGEYGPTRPAANGTGPTAGEADEADETDQADETDLIGAAARFAELGKRLLRIMTHQGPGTGSASTAGATSGTDGPPGRLTVRQVARTRTELALLLERRLIELFNPTVEQVRKSMVRSLEQQDSGRSAAGASSLSLLTPARRELKRLAKETLGRDE